jgi:hypothetical protein
LDKSKEDLVYQSLERDLPMATKEDEEKTTERRVSETKIVSVSNNERPKTTLVQKTKQVTARLLSPQAISANKKHSHSFVNSSVSVIKGDQKKTNLVYQAIMESKAEAEVV